jgi:transcriptional regulator with XRE-family HTH domain
MEIGERIKQLRERNGMTQKALADSLNRAQNTISQYENSILQPDINTIHAMADIFKISIDEFMNPRIGAGIGTIEHIQAPSENKTNDGFAIMLIRRLIDEKIITNPNDIDQETIDMITAALKKDIKRVQDEEKNKD